MKFLSAIVLIGILFFLHVGQLARAQEIEISPSQLPIPTLPIAYILPYPGLMPGHFLYPLKVVRDKVSGFLISNPLKKADFNLLQADKKVEMSFMLINRNKEDVDTAAQIFSKAENYFEEAVRKTAEAKKQGMDSSDMIKRLTLANQKYKEVILIIEKNISVEDRLKFERNMTRLEELKKSVNRLER